MKRRFLLSLMALLTMAAYAETDAIVEAEAAEKVETEATAETETEASASEEAATTANTKTFNYATLRAPSLAYTAPKYQFFKSVEVEKPYTFMDDQTFVGIPLFAAGLIIRSEKTSFRQNIDDKDPLRAKDRLVTNFKSKVDDYLQFAPLAVAIGLKLGGVDGRSDWGRFLVSGAMSYAIMAAIVNPIKYTAKEMRPDGSSANSFPSGHTATAFVGATILHKEYGLTHSPWYSIGGYAVATATGVMRVLNNRHWVSDVLAGAGIGIFSTELAYGLSNLIFKGKGLRRTDIVGDESIVTNPTFFSINMGVGIGNKNLNFDFDYNDPFADEVSGDDSFKDSMPFRFKPSTYVGAEGAYFFNKYIGVGGRLGVRSTPVEGFGDVASWVQDSFTGEVKDFNDMLGQPDIIDIDKFKVSIESDHFTEFNASIGAYFNLPLSRRFALGAKVLIGRSIMDDIDLDMDVSGKSIASVLEYPDGTYKAELGPEYQTKWDFINVKCNNTMTYGTGISLTYAYKSTFSWRVFADYDYSRKTYTMTMDPFHFYTALAPDLFHPGDPELAVVSAEPVKKHMNHFTFGGSFCVSF